MYVAACVTGQGTTWGRPPSPLPPCPHLPAPFPGRLVGHILPGPLLLTHWSPLLASLLPLRVAGPRTLSSPSPKLLHLRPPPQASPPLLSSWFWPLRGPAAGFPFTAHPGPPSLLCPRAWAQASTIASPPRGSLVSAQLWAWGHVAALGTGSPPHAAQASLCAGAPRMAAGPTASWRSSSVASAWNFPRVVHPCFAL